MTWANADVYRNLHRRDASVRLGGRVVAHLRACLASGVVFRVQPGTLARVRQTGVRAVCAYARCERVTVEDPAELRALIVGPAWQRLRFNPHTADGFALDDGTPVRTAHLLAMLPEGAWVAGAGCVCCEARR